MRKPVQRQALAIHVPVVKPSGVATMYYPAHNKSPHYRME
jgi:hypothetical protein